MDRVFLDANVLFSAAYRADSGLVALWRLTTSQLLTSAYALSEAERNLTREDQRRRLAALVRSCEIVPTPSLERLPSRVILPGNDQPILSQPWPRKPRICSPATGLTLAGEQMR